MGTTADKLNKLLETKEAIKQAIRDKGAYIGDYDAFAEYPDAIRSIETGSGEGGEEITGSYIIAKFPDDMEEGNNLLIRAIELDMSSFNTSNVENMNDMFNDYFNLRELNLSNFNTENVKEMTSMFNGCANLAELDLSSFNTSNVENMENMFNRCANLAELDLSSFNTSNVENMNYMFNECMNLEVLDIRNFDTSNVREMYEMFNGCENLHTLRLDNCNRNTIEKVVTPREFPTGAIDGVTRKIYVNPNNIWGLEAPEDWIFVDSDGNEIGGEEEPEEVTAYVIATFNTTESVQIMGEPSDSWLSSYDEGNTWESHSNTTRGNEVVYLRPEDVNYVNIYRLFEGCSYLTEAAFFDFSNVSINPYSDNMFNGCVSLESLDLNSLNLDGFNVEMMFNGCNNLRELHLEDCNHETIEKIINEANLPTGEVDGETRKMHVNPDNLGDLEAPENWIFVDLDGNEIGGEEEIGEPEIYVPGYYRGNSDITEATTMVNNTHTDLSEMFSGCTNLTTINNIEQWDTSNVTNMVYMFQNCDSLTSLDLSNFDTSSVTNMYRMFYSCQSLTTLDLSNFDTSNVTDMGYMFSNCNNLTSLDLSNFDTSKVTKMQSTFSVCSNLTTLDIRNFNMSNVTNTQYMFLGCKNLHTLRLDNCNNATIRKIINSSNFNTDAIEGVTRKIYCTEENAAGLTPPTNWIFEYVD